MTATTPTTPTTPTGPVADPAVGTATGPKGSDDTTIGRWSS